MSRALRNTNPEIVHLVTCRTLCAQLLMAPSDVVNDIIGGVIARYQEEHEIEIFSLTVLSNHYHFLSRAPKKLLWNFCANVNREIARRVNRHLGREGTFWHKRYDDQIVIEDYDALEGLIYIVLNPVRHGLVEYQKNWPGLSTFFSLATGKEKKYLFTHWTEYNRAKRRAKRTGEPVFLRDYQTEHTLKLTPLRSFKEKGLLQQWTYLEPLIEKRRKEYVKARRESGKGFLGRKQILLQKPVDFPREVSKSNRPICYTKNFEAKKIYQEELRILNIWYKKASFKFRSGQYDIEFPPYTIKPPTHYVPTLNSS